MRVALEKGVEVVSVNDPFIDLAYMVISQLLRLILPVVVFVLWNYSGLGEVPKCVPLVIITVHYFTGQVIFMSSNQQH